MDRAEDEAVRDGVNNEAATIGEDGLGVDRAEDEAVRDGANN